MEKLDIEKIFNNCVNKMATITQKNISLSLTNNDNFIVVYDNDGYAIDSTYTWGATSIAFDAAINKYVCSVSISKFIIINELYDILIATIFHELCHAFCFKFCLENGLLKIDKANNQYVADRDVWNDWVDTDNGHGSLWQTAAKLVTTAMNLKYKLTATITDLESDLLLDTYGDNWAYSFACDGCGNSIKFLGFDPNDRDEMRNLLILMLITVLAEDNNLPAWKAKVFAECHLCNYTPVKVIIRDKSVVNKVMAFLANDPELQFIADTIMGDEN